jgi:hypothetical protein
LLSGFALLAAVFLYSDVVFCGRAREFMSPVCAAHYEIQVIRVVGIEHGFERRATGRRYRAWRQA